MDGVCKVVFSLFTFKNVEKIIFSWIIMYNDNQNNIDYRLFKTFHSRDND